MLTGKLPFRGATVGELLIAAVRDEPRKLADFGVASPELTVLVERCLAKDPAQRPSTARELITALDLEPASAAFANTERAPAVPSIALAKTEQIVSDPPKAVSNDPIAETKRVVASEDAAPRARKRQSMRVVLAILFLGIIGGPLAFFMRENATPRAVAPVDAADDEHRTVGLLDLPIPEHCNEAAKIEYRAALEAVHGRGVGYGYDGFVRAIKADPSCGEAHLRAAIDSPGTAAAREHYNQAALHRDRMSERDRRLVDVYTPFYEEPPEYRRSAERLIALSHDRPRDADLLVQLGYFLWVYDPNNELATLAQRAVDIDPGYSTAWLILGVGRMKAGDEAGAQEAYVHCAQTIGTAVDCVGEGAHHAQWLGRCAEMEALSLKLTARSPDKKADAYRLLASAFASNKDGGGTDEALHQYSSALGPDEAWEGVLEQARFAIAFGDFDRAAPLLATVEGRIRDSRSRPTHAVFAQVRFDLELELDRPAAAIAIAEDFAERESAWTGPLDDFYGTGDDGFNLVPRMLALQAARGKITAEKRDREIAAWVDRQDTIHDARMRWVAQSAILVETAADAERALAVMPVPDAKVVPLRGYSSAIAGRVLALGGRTAQGIAELQNFTSRCERLDNPITQTQAYLWLAEALEASGQKAEACAQYSVVTSRWHAPSRSAKRAAERLKALGCK
jgi:hypothetical protein